MAHLDALQGQAWGGVLTVDGRHRMTVKHPTQVLWPQLGLTTVEVMRSYVRVAPVLLPHVKDRPLSFRRFAQGVDGPRQFHQRPPSGPPPSRRKQSSSKRA
jgi:bifunctional non-homologous end joining protein LigD